MIRWSCLRHIIIRRLDWERHLCTSTIKRLPPTQEKMCKCSQLNKKTKSVAPPPFERYQFMHFYILLWNTFPHRFTMCLTLHDSCRSNTYPRPRIQWQLCRCRGHSGEKPSTAACPSDSRSHQTPWGRANSWAFRLCSKSQHDAAIKQESEKKTNTKNCSAQSSGSFIHPFILI